MLHLPKFGPIWVVMHMDHPSVQVRHAIKQQFLGWLEQLLGSCGVFSGRLAGAWKSPAPHAARVCGQNCFADDFLTLDGSSSMFYCSHYSCYYISICVFVQPAHAVARQSTFCSFLFAAPRSTHTALNLFSPFAFVSFAANGFKVESSLEEINIWFTSVGWYGGNVRTLYLHMGRFHLICYFDVSINSLSQEKDYSTGIIFVAKLQSQAT